MLKIKPSVRCNFRINYKYTENGELRTGVAYFATSETAEKFCTRLMYDHPDATIH